jgi:hypothetical protein
MTGAVADSVRTRAEKVSFRSVLRDEFETQGGAHCFDDLMIAQMGWVDGAELRSSYQTFAHVRAATFDGAPPPRALWNALWLDRWFRAMFPD